MKSIVVAYDKNMAIGVEGKLLWQSELPANQRRFRNLTRGSAVVMGRKTYELMGNILHGRLNVVVTHKFMQMPELALARGLSEAYEIAEGHDIVVIGGASIYEQALPDVKRIYATEIHTELPNADSYFPKFSRPDWQEVKREQHYADGENKFDYDFVVYERA